MLTVDQDSRVKYRSQKEDGGSSAETSEVFEITDFTTASDWERLISRLEDVIQDWKLSRFPHETRLLKDSFVNGKWKEISSDITDVPDFEFLIKRINVKLPDGLEKPLAEHEEPSAPPPPRLASASKTCFSVNEFPAVFEQMLSTENDFPNSTTIHPLCRWFGLADLLILTASPFNKIDWKFSEDRLKLIASSMVVAVSNTKCPVPMFFQFDEPARSMFTGVSDFFGFRTLYEVIDLEKVPDRLKTLSGLVEIFKEKILQRPDQEPQLIKTSIQFTVDLNPDEVDFETLSEDVVDDRKSGGLGSLPFGPLEFDSFLLRLFTSWPNANADAIEDTLLHTDLDPLQAPKWAVQLILNDESSYRLADTLMNFAKQIHRKETVQSFLDYLERDALTARVEAEQGDQAAEILNRLTGEKRGRLRSRLSKAFYSRLPKYQLPVPIDADSLNEVLSYLFPDSDLAKELPRKFPSVAERKESAFKTMKAAPCDSLPFKLALAVHYVFEKFSGLLGVAYLWQEVLLELRFRWENGFLVAGVESGMPNHGTCLLHQKLQMLNCCIAKRDANPAAVSSSSTATSPQTIKSPSSVYPDVNNHEIVTDEDEDEDEFYDCETDDGVEEVGSGGGSPRVVKGPEGRKEAHGVLRLLREPETPLYVPVTQEPAPMTEDMAQEHLERMVATDDDEDGRALRTRMQSVTLVSDMSAFKAANPGCVFEDFVRWHSPRDWEFDGEESLGHLSERMSQAGSAWMEAWDSAEPKPVRKQKRLFDERVEAEKVLSFLSMSIGGIFRHTLPMLLQAGVIRLFDEMDATSISAPCDKPALLRSVSRLLCDPNFNWLEYEKILKSVRLSEQVTSTYRTLENVTKRTGDLPDAEGFKAFLQSVIESRQVTGIPGGARSPLGQCLAAVFDQTHREGSSPATAKHEMAMKKCQLPAPTGKDIILRTVAPRPHAFSRPSVQRMYASIRGGDVRIAGAFSEDLMYG